MKLLQLKAIFITIFLIILFPLYKSTFFKKFTLNTNPVGIQKKDRLAGLINTGIRKVVEKNAIYKIAENQRSYELFYRKFILSTDGITDKERKNMLENAYKTFGQEIHLHYIDKLKRYLEFFNKFMTKNKKCPETEDKVIESRTLKNSVTFKMIVGTYKNSNVELFSQLAGKFLAQYKTELSSKIPNFVSQTKLTQKAINDNYDELNKCYKAINNKDLGKIDLEANISNL